MKRLIVILYIVVSSAFLIYLFLPSIPFPEALPDSKQSVEPADSETPLRRAYFTDFNREEVLSYYNREFSIKVGEYQIPSYMLTYPPEDAFPLIRDQTRSTHLREIVYPFRESFFVNEFVPQVEKDDIWYKGVHYEQKVTVSIKQSPLWARLGVGVMTIIVVWFVFTEFFRACVDFLRAIRRLKFPFFWV